MRQHFFQKVIQNYSRKIILPCSTSRFTNSNFWRDKNIGNVLKGKLGKGFCVKKNTLSSHNKGRWRTISRGSVSAAMIISSAIPLFKVFVASLAPFFNYGKFSKESLIWKITLFKAAACCTRLRSFLVSSLSARGLVLEISESSYSYKVKKSFEWIWTISVMLNQ